MNELLTHEDSPEVLRSLGGGKAANMARLSRNGFRVPPWFCISTLAFRRFVEQNSFQDELTREKDPGRLSRRAEELFQAGEMPASLLDRIFEKIRGLSLEDRFLAVRSSGTDEDAPDHSFAGQLSSFLFQKGPAAVERSLRSCWASGFSERALVYRREHGLGVKGMDVAVVIQQMVDADTAGVAFSRNPVRPLDRERLIINSTWGLGEGVVSGEMDADTYQVQRETLKFEPLLAHKEYAFRQAPEGGLVRVPVPEDDRRKSSLVDDQVREVACLVMELEKRLGGAQDCEWVYENEKLYCVQTRPITRLPHDAFFRPDVKGDEPILWDNSNIIESYCGVTAPLTFTFAVRAYRQVYTQFCQVMGVPEEMIASHESVFRNLLGLLRGRIYYHLIHWYRLLLLLPGAAGNQAFMETMMGVKQALKPEMASLFDFMKDPPRYSLWKRLWVTGMTLHRFRNMDRIVADFQGHFNRVYENGRKMDFSRMPLTQQAEFYRTLDREILARWQAPIINDYLCMIFFGLLKKLTEKWLAEGDEGSSLQNDLLCGEGDLASTEPTKMLMRIAEMIDKGDPAFREWFISTDVDRIWPELADNGRSPEVLARLREFLDRYGFRCVNELKLEEEDLHDDPSFVLHALTGYVRTKNYSIQAMETREREIRAGAEARVKKSLRGIRRVLFFWVLKHARRAVGLRENLRFDRTKIFGLIRHLFRAMGENLAELGHLDAPRDVFYLSFDELFSFVEGRAVSIRLSELAGQRKKEFDEYRKTPAPPDRFLSYGAVGASVRYEQVLLDADLLRDEARDDADPALLFGTPCCPGVVEGTVRVVREMKDAEGIAGEILVTERTDPGWVPLYPSCSGLLIERGSLLSHSAVVARELGLPTIVSISGGMMQRLKTGQRVRMDAGRGEIRILEEE